MSRLSCPLLVAAILAAALASRAHGSSTVSRISVDSAGAEVVGLSLLLTLSGDGRYVAFSSDAPGLVPNDTNGLHDIFVKDRETGAVQRVSVSTAGTQSTAHSVCPVISADGKVVVFASWDNNLAPNDGTIQDVFLRDLTTGVTETVSVALPGQIANEVCALPTVSADGRYVAFYGTASNLVANDTNGLDDAFLRDRTLGTTVRVSVGLGGAQPNGPSIFPNVSADGRYVVFSSIANNLVANDTNVAQDVFRYDTQTGATERVSVSSAGVQSSGGNSVAAGIGAVSADGRFVVFTSRAVNLVPGDTNLKEDVFLRDMQLGSTVRVSETPAGTAGNGHCFWAVISLDGRYVAYDSLATNIVTGDGNFAADVFLYDVLTKQTRRVSQSDAGVIGDEQSLAPAISGDGRYVGFYSEASNLVANDTNVSSDLFVSSQCWVELSAMGSGLAGASGIVPVLGGYQGVCEAGGYEIRLDDVVAPSTAFLLVGTGFLDQFPVLGGHLYIDLAQPFLMVALPVTGPGIGPGQGSLVLNQADLGAAAGLSLFMQAFVADPAAFAGAAISNALKVSIGF